MEQLLVILFIAAAGLIDLIQRWQRRAKRPPLEREPEIERPWELENEGTRDARPTPDVIFDLEEILRGTARPRKPAPPPVAPAPVVRRKPLPPPAPEGPRGPRRVVAPIVRPAHPLLQMLRRPADVRQAIVVSTVLGRCPGME
ncbi:MAG: hypothetical protein RL625_1213 [Gemmatimonadota bacterium]|jgi:hypothetical protein